MVNADARSDVATWVQSLFWRAVLLCLLLLGFISVLPALLAVAFMFDDPASATSLFAYVFSAAILLFPVSCFAGAILTYATRKKPHARWFLLLPLAYFLTVAAIFGASALFCKLGFFCH